ncbi:DUF221-domain-containing protein [Cylindrobasidium torrendii FP15055 ss-10]|uniref:DUF221-domain-containing protein n=1 Tax=Cylindrobasidium torrendii FP15055 ss-10 TaxID=1314674 RepID=A0A0D7BV35_9AGAR|nr:DUF221-domain-containing protein [Cylindrobasidium torrendii FP15055 ss-10]
MSISAADANKKSTTKTFATALVANGGLLLVEVGAFLILKQKLGRIYSPRTFLPPPDKRAEELPKGLWKWLPALLFTSSKDIIHKNGLDAYMFLRFIKMLVWIFLAFTLLSFAVIIPVDMAGIQSGHVGLDRLSWVNIVDEKDHKRLTAHITVVYVLTFFVFWLVRHEMLHFIHMRHQFLISKEHSRLPQARTVLLTSVPDELATDHDMRQFASFIPGGVDRVWFFRDTRTLNDLFEARQDACTMLETASASVVRDAVRSWRKTLKAHRKAFKKKNKDAEKLVMPDLPQPEPSKALLDELVPFAQRPKHRTGFLGLWGPKVDTIEWCAKEISRLNGEIDVARENHDKEGKFLGSAFWMEAHPKDVVWSNLDDGALQMRTRKVLSWLATVGLIIAWAFPSTFIGTLSNLDDLCHEFTWLAWVCTAHDPVPAIVQGVLPPTLLAILFALLPLVLKALAWYECIPRYSLMSVSVYKRFFLFLLIHGFLIVTLSSGITQAIQDIVEQPTQTVQQLAQQLPGAAIFFLTYLSTQGLAAAGGALAQLVPMLMHFGRKLFLGRTPRQAYEVTFMMPAGDFGVIMPRLSLLATIAFAYSILSPMINLMALVTFCMHYLAFKFLCTQVYDQPEQSETGGMYFPMAISNLFVGLYIEQVSLACLFFLKISIDRDSSLIKGVFMLILVAITVSFQSYINSTFEPLTHFLPMSLATTKMATRYARQRHEKQINKSHEKHLSKEDSMDLFDVRQVSRLKRRMQAIPKKMDKSLGQVRQEVKRQFVPPRRSDEASLRRDWRKNGSDGHGMDEYQMTDSLEPSEDWHESPSAWEQSSQSAGLSRTTTVASRSQSVKSHKSSKYGHDDKSDDNGSSDGEHQKREFAAPSPAGVDLSDEEGDDALQEDEHAFDHPSTYEEQPWIWLPRDELGLSEILVGEFREAGIDASCEGATMDAKGVVEVSRNPPDLEWTGGHDA